MKILIHAAAWALMLATAATAGAQPRRDRDRDRDRDDVSLFDRRDFQGYIGALNDDTRNFDRHGLNDRVASIIVRRGRWEFCTDANYRGDCRVYGPGEYRSLPGGHDDAYSSARQAASRKGPSRGRGGPSITLYDSPSFGGRSLHLEDSAHNLELLRFNDRVESVIVERGRWRLCSDANGAGRCRDFGPGEYPSLTPDLRSKLSSVRRH